MDPVEVITAHYQPGSALSEMLIAHSRLVAQKALAIARSLESLNPDMDFIHEAAMLHDIGIFMTNTPELGCTGNLPYICHGYLGRALLEHAGLARHGLVCERHVGVGLTVEEIETRNLPVPLRDMTPQTLEEQIICYADKFYSKNGGTHPAVEKSVDQIIQGLFRYGQDKIDRFLFWHHQFEASVNPHPVDPA
ncbi:MAG: HDIG domain-containing protein [Deltaproteobacteria bacterium]|nr:HDIG domain-containing protein [Deltaproteobacteria bacterium]